MKQLERARTAHHDLPVSAPRPRLFATCMAVALLLGCGAPARRHAEFGSWTPPIRATPEIAALERAMYQRVNRDRAAEGLAPFAWDARLADVARGHSLEMADNDFFAHESPSTGTLEDRMDHAGYLAAEMRENLAAATDVDTAEDNLLNSEGHRKNLMSTSVSHIGIGIVRGDPEGNQAGMLTVTQVFANPTPLASPETMRGEVVALLDQARQKAGLPKLTEHPTLQRVVEAHIAKLPDDLPEGAVSDIGASMGRDLSADPSHGLRNISLAAQVLANANELSLPSSVKERTTRHYGMVTTKARDERGRPKVKVLVLFGG
jgi:uncharacterized protein YkwD